MASAKPAYCPDVGDVIAINFDPQAGREMAGPHPALVLSPKAYNEKARLCVLCPITSKVKGYPFEVPFPPGDEVKGVVLADQVKSLSWEQRAATFSGKAPPQVLASTLGMVKALLGL